MNAPSIERLRAAFSLQDDGSLIWISPPANHAELKGLPAGAAGHSRYWKRYHIIKLDGCAIKRARVVFALTNGRWPSGEIDHRDGDSLNDRPSNLREATHLQNAWNLKRMTKRSDLPMGVREMTKGRFQARVRCDGTVHYLGCFSSPQAASVAYQAKRKELFGDFA